MAMGGKTGASDVDVDDRRPADTDDRGVPPSAATSDAPDAPASGAPDGDVPAPGDSHPDADAPASSTPDPAEPAMEPETADEPDEAEPDEPLDSTITLPAPDAEHDDPEDGLEPRSADDPEPAPDPRPELEPEAALPVPPTVGGENIPPTVGGEDVPPTLGGEDNPPIADDPTQIAAPVVVAAAQTQTGPRFTPPPYEPPTPPPNEPPTPPPAPAPEPQTAAVERHRYVPQPTTGHVPIQEIEGGWEAVYRRRRRQTLTFLGGLAAVLVVGFFAWLTYAGVVPWPFGGTITVSQNVCTRSQPLPPKRITVRVFNGSSRDGLAGQVATQLKSLGFAVKLTGNDPLETKLKTPVEIRHGENGDLAAATMSAYVVGKVNDVQDDRQDGTIDVVLGPSFSRLKNKAELKKSLAAVTSTLPLTCPEGVTPTPSASATSAASPRPSASPKR